MFTLTFKGPDGSEQTAQLEAEVSVGREEGNDLVLPDSAISRRHCRFFVEGDQVVVEDLGSSNGVVVDGERIEGPTTVSGTSEIFVAEWQVSVGEGRAGRVSPKRKGSNGPTTERPGGSNGARATKQLAAARPGKALAKPGADRPLSRPSSSGRANAIAKPSGSGGRASIKGTTGPWTGRSFTLTKPVTVVGRSAPADIVVDDDSVSRRHLEIRKGAEGYVVRDLGSANGILVNEESVSEHPLQDGDEVKLGVVSFIYSGPSAPKAGMPARKKRLLLMGVVGGVVVLGGVGALAVLGGNNSKEQYGAPPPEEKQADTVGTVMPFCKMYSDTDSNELDWKKAQDKCNEVLKLDPLNVEAMQLAKLAKREREFEALFKEGKRLSEVGRDEEAVDQFLRIDKKSFFFSRARNGFLDAKTHISRKTLDECRTWSQNGRDWCKAAEWCARYLDFNCCNRDITEDKSRLDKAISNCGSRPAVPWSCPRKYCEFAGQTETLDTGKALREKLAAKYVNPKVTDTMLEYAMKGNARKAADDLKRFKYTPDGKKMGKEVEATIADLEVVDGRYTTGSTLIDRDPDGAALKFKDAIEADSHLMPAGEQGAIVHKMKSELAATYLHMAASRLDQDRPTEAGPLALKAWEQDTGNTDLIQLMKKLEDAADKYMNQGCPGLAKAKKMLRSGSPVMTEVQERWRKLNCTD